MLVTNDIAMGGNPDKHYITIIMQAQVSPSSPELNNNEPDKCAGWEWIPWARLQEMVAEDSSAFFEPAVKAIKELSFPFDEYMIKCL
jgi:isopentenyldiphosphate isomerase